MELFDLLQAVSGDSEQLVGLLQSSQFNVFLSKFASMFLA